MSTREETLTIKASYIFPVAVKRESGAGFPEKRGTVTDHPFGFLGPAGMGDIGIYIGLETIFVRLKCIPEGRRTVVKKFDFYD